MKKTVEDIKEHLMEVLEDGKKHHHEDAFEDMMSLMAKVIHYSYEHGDTTLKDEIKERLCIIANGEHFNEEVSEKVVENLHGQYGRHGEQISMYDAEKLALANGIRFDKFNKFDWYVALNMVMVHNHVKNDELIKRYRIEDANRLYVNDAKCFLDSANVYRHYKHTMKCKSR